MKENRMTEEEIAAYYTLRNALQNSRVCKYERDANKMRELAHLHASLLNVSRHIAWIRLDRL